MSKWVKGDQIRDPEVVIRMILSGLPIFDRHKVQTPGWTLSWPLHLIVNRTRAGHFSIALPANLPVKRNPE